MCLILYLCCRKHSDKMPKHFRDCDREGNQFFSLVVEALVGWHTDAAAAVAKLIRQLASHTGGREKEEETTICDIYQLFQTHCEL